MAAQGITWATGPGAAAGLDALADLDGVDSLAGYHLLPAARADFLRRLGRLREAVAAYAQARDLTLNDRERAFLTRRIAECEEASKSPREGA